MSLVRMITKQKPIDKRKMIHMHEIEVSIVIPTYNRKNSLMETVISLCNQTFSKSNYEIIVCDDNSTDGTEEVISELIRKSNNNLRYFKIKSDIKGPAKVRNVGIMNAFGGIIGFTDDDCIVSKNWIETAINSFGENKDALGVYGTVLPMGNCRSERFKVERNVEVLEDNGSYVTPNIFYKKSILLDVGGFDPKIRFWEDIELGWRVKNKGKIIFNPDVLVYHKVLCLSWMGYLNRMKRIEFHVLMYSKHPERLKEDKLIFNHIYNRSVFYILFMILSAIAYPFQLNIAFFFLFCAIIAYMWAHVLIDNNRIKYPIRIVLFPRYLIPDIIRFIYSLKASIKTKCLVLF